MNQGQTAREIFAKRIQELVKGKSFRQLSDDIYLKTGKRISHSQLFQYTKPNGKNPTPESVDILAEYAGKPAAWFFTPDSITIDYPTITDREIFPGLIANETSIPSNLLYNLSLKDWIDFLTQTLTRSGITLTEQDRRQIAEIAMIIVNMLVNQKLKQEKPPNT